MFNKIGKLHGVSLLAQKCYESWMFEKAAKFYVPTCPIFNGSVTNVLSVLVDYTWYVMWYLRAYVLIFCKQISFLLLINHFILWLFLLQLSTVHQAWCINNVVHHVLRHVILMKMQIVVVVVLKDVSVQVEKLYITETVLMRLSVKVNTLSCMCTPLTWHICCFSKTFVIKSFTRVTGVPHFINNLALTINIQ